MPTQKYLCLQRRAPGTNERPTKAQMQEMMASFDAWRQTFSAQIVDLGGKLEPGGKIVTATGVSDGPYIEAKEVIGGYMIIAAESYEQALEIARQSPGATMPGSTIEVRAIAGS